MVKRLIPRSRSPAPSDSEEQDFKGDPLTASRLGWLERLGLDREPSTLELRLAIRLALGYANRFKSRALFKKHGAPIAFPNQATLAEELGVTRQAIGAAARRLEKRGYLACIPGLGRGHATEYRLIEKGNQAVCLSETPKRQKPTPKKENARTPKGKNRGDKRQTGSLPQSLSFQSNNQSHSQSNEGRFDFGAGVKGVKESDHPDFEELFDLWPNEDKHRGKALGAWINNVARNGVDPELVLESADRWVRYWRRKNTKFIPYLGKWLADCGWEDNPPASPHDAYHDRIDELASSHRNKDEDDFWQPDRYTYDPDSPD